MSLHKKIYIFCVVIRLGLLSNVVQIKFLNKKCLLTSVLCCCIFFE